MPKNSQQLKPLCVCVRILRSYSIRLSWPSINLLHPVLADTIKKPPPPPPIINFLPFCLTENCYFVVSTLWTFNFIKGLYIFLAVLYHNFYSEGNKGEFWEEFIKIVAIYCGMQLQKKKTAVHNSSWNFWKIVTFIGNMIVAWMQSW